MDALTAADLVSLIKEPSAALCEGHIRQRDAWDMLDDSGFGYYGLPGHHVDGPNGIPLERCCMPAMMGDLAQVSSSSTSSSNDHRPAFQFAVLTRYDVRRESRRSPSLRAQAKQSSVREASWIASSLRLLAMTMNGASCRPARAAPYSFQCSDNDQPEKVPL